MNWQYTFYFLKKLFSCHFFAGNLFTCHVQITLDPLEFVLEFYMPREKFHVILSQLFLF